MTLRITPRPGRRGRHTLRATMQPPRTQHQVLAVPLYLLLQVVVFDVLLPPGARQFDRQPYRPRAIHSSPKPSGFCIVSMNQ